MELGLEVQLDRHLLAPVLRLPPALAPVRSERRDDVLDVVAASVVAAWTVRSARVADEALIILILQMADDTESFWMVKAAGRRRRQVVLAANQKVPRGWVTTALLTGARRSPIS